MASIKKTFFVRAMRMSSLAWAALTVSGFSPSTGLLFSRRNFAASKCAWWGVAM
jgi:hypothetical protein